jgi:hypothetical protein
MGNLLFRCPRTGLTNVNWWGMLAWLITSSMAPVFARLRSVQEIVLPPNAMVPALKTRWRWSAVLVDGASYRKKPTLAALRLC